MHPNKLSQKSESQLQKIIPTLNSNKEWVVRNTLKKHNDIDTQNNLFSHSSSKNDFEENTEQTNQYSTQYSRPQQQQSQFVAKNPSDVRAKSSFQQVNLRNFKINAFRTTAQQDSLDSIDKNSIQKDKDKLMHNYILERGDQSRFTVIPDAFDSRFIGNQYQNLNKKQQINGLQSHPKRRLQNQSHTKSQKIQMVQTFGKNSYIKSDNELNNQMSTIISKPRKLDALFSQNSLQQLPQNNSLQYLQNNLSVLVDEEKACKEENLERLKKVQNLEDLIKFKVRTVSDKYRTNNFIDQSYPTLLQHDKIPSQLTEKPSNFNINRKSLFTKEEKNNIYTKQTQETNEDEEKYLQAKQELSSAKEQIKSEIDQLKSDELLSYDFSKFVDQKEKIKNLNKQIDPVQLLKSYFLRKYEESDNKIIQFKNLKQEDNQTERTGFDQNSLQKIKLGLVVGATHENYLVSKYEKMKKLGKIDENQQKLEKFIQHQQSQQSKMDINQPSQHYLSEMPSHDNPVPLKQQQEISETLTEKYEDKDLSNLENMQNELKRIFDLDKMDQNLEVKKNFENQKDQINQLLDLIQADLTFPDYLDDYRKQQKEKKENKKITEVQTGYQHSELLKYQGVRNANQFNSYIVYSKEQMELAKKLKDSQKSEASLNLVRRKNKKKAQAVQQRINSKTENKQVGKVVFNINNQNSIYIQQLLLQKINNSNDNSSQDKNLFENINQKNSLIYQSQSISDTSTFQMPYDQSKTTIIQTNKLDESSSFRQREYTTLGQLNDFNVIQQFKINQKINTYQERGLNSLNSPKDEISQEIRINYQQKQSDQNTNKSQLNDMIAEVSEDDRFNLNLSPGALFGTIDEIQQNLNLPMKSQIFFDQQDNKEYFLVNDFQNDKLNKTDQQHYADNYDQFKEDDDKNILNFSGESKISKKNILTGTSETQKNNQSLERNSRISIYSREIKIKKSSHAQTIKVQQDYQQNKQEVSIQENEIEQIQTNRSNLKKNQNKEEQQFTDPLNIILTQNNSDSNEDLNTATQFVSDIQEVNKDNKIQKQFDLSERTDTINLEFNPKSASRNTKHQTTGIVKNVVVNTKSYFSKSPKKNIFVGGGFSTKQFNPFQNVHQSQSNQNIQKQIDIVKKSWWAPTRYKKFPRFHVYAPNGQQTDVQNQLQFARLQNIHAAKHENKMFFNLNYHDIAIQLESVDEDIQVEPESALQKKKDSTVTESQQKIQTYSQDLESIAQLSSLSQTQKPRNRNSQINTLKQIKEVTLDDTEQINQIEIDDANKDNKTFETNMVRFNSSRTLFTNNENNKKQISLVDKIVEPSGQQSESNINFKPKFDQQHGNFRGQSPLVHSPRKTLNSSLLMQAENSGSNSKEQNTGIDLPENPTAFEAFKKTFNFGVQTVQETPITQTQIPNETYDPFDKVLLTKVIDNQILTSNRTITGSNNLLSSTQKIIHQRFQANQLANSLKFKIQGKNKELYPVDPEFLSQYLNQIALDRELQNMSLKEKSDLISNLQIIREWQIQKRILEENIQQKKNSSEVVNSLQRNQHGIQANEFDIIQVFFDSLIKEKENQENKQKVVINSKINFQSQNDYDQTMKGEDFQSNNNETFNEFQNTKNNFRKQVLQQKKDLPLIEIQDEQKGSKQIIPSKLQNEEIQRKNPYMNLSSMQSNKKNAQVQAKDLSTHQVSLQIDMTQKINVQNSGQSTVVGLQEFGQKSVKSQSKKIIGYKISNLSLNEREVINSTELLTEKSKKIIPNQQINQKIKLTKGLNESGTSSKFLGDTVKNVSYDNQVLNVNPNLDLELSQDDQKFISQIIPNFGLLNQADKREELLEEKSRQIMSSKYIQEKKTQSISQQSNKSIEPSAQPPSNVAILQMSNLGSTLLEFDNSVILPNNQDIAKNNNLNGYQVNTDRSLNSANNQVQTLQIQSLLVAGQNDVDNKDASEVLKQQNKTQYKFTGGFRNLSVIKSQKQLKFAQEQQLKKDENNQQKIEDFQPLFLYNALQKANEQNLTLIQKILEDLAIQYIQSNSPKQNQKQNSSTQDLINKGVEVLNQVQQNTTSERGTTLKKMINEIYQKEQRYVPKGMLIGSDKDPSLFINAQDLILDLSKAKGNSLLNDPKVNHVDGQIFIKSKQVQVPIHYKETQKNKGTKRKITNDLASQAYEGKNKKLISKVSEIEKPSPQDESLFGSHQISRQNFEIKPVTQKLSKTS